MFKNLFYRLISPRHRFRHMSFDELSELYTSMMLRSLAMSMAGIFIPIYLYQYGYPVWRILSFYALVFVVQTILCVPVAKLIALVGPKHTMLISYVLQIFTMVSLFYIDLVPNIYIISLIFGGALITFFMAFHIDFSKVKHSKKGGSELGFLFIMERSGFVLGPIIGGLIAYQFSPKYTFAFSMLLLFSAVVPLMLTKEPTRTKQIIDFSKLKISSIKHTLVSYSALTIDTVSSNVVWPLFVGVIIFADNQYLILGSISSIAIIVSIFVAKMIGKIVDNKKGRNLLRFNVLINSFVHILRPFTAGYVPALGINLLNEGVTTGYRMPYLKGFYDAADDHPGQRIVYVAVVEMFGTLFRALFFILATVLAYSMATDRVFFGVLFFITAGTSLMIMFERFPALNARRTKS